MIPEKWLIEEELTTQSGRVMAKVLIGTNNKENVYEYIYKDIYQGILGGMYEYNEFSKAIPPVCVLYQGKLIPHNEGVVGIKDEIKAQLGMVPAKLIFHSYKNKKAGSDDYAIARLLDKTYNIELVRLSVREFFEEESC